MRHRHASLPFDSLGATRIEHLSPVVSQVVLQTLRDVFQTISKIKCRVPELPNKFSLPASASGSLVIIFILQGADTSSQTGDPRPRDLDIHIGVKSRGIQEPTLEGRLVARLTPRARTAVFAPTGTGTQETNCDQYSDSYS